MGKKEPPDPEIPDWQSNVLHRPYPPCLRLRPPVALPGREGLGQERPMVLVNGCSEGGCKQARERALPAKGCKVMATARRAPPNASSGETCVTEEAEAFVGARLCGWTCGGLIHLEGGKP